MPKPDAICVYCGSSSNTRESHRVAAAALGTMLAREEVSLVFGGGRVGLMGVMADAALAAGGEVVGVIPSFLMEREVGHSACSALHVTETMHERKQKMAELADGFAIFPGGLGTLDEAFEIITWKQLGLHDKPIVVADIDGYWRPLRSLLDNIRAENYFPQQHRELVRFVESAGSVLPALSDMPGSGGRLESERI